jgi:hypothetical protein
LARKRLYIALKSGANFVISMDAQPKNLGEIFQGSKWWIPEKLFNTLEYL